MYTMKGMFYSCVKRAFFSKKYAASIIGTIIMCFICSKEYFSPDANSAYIIDLMINLGMFKKTIVFFSAFPFVTVFYDDFNSKFIYSVVLRSGENKYILSSVICCVMTGFSALFLGIIAFFSMLSLLYPCQAYETIGVYSTIALNHPIFFVFIITSIFSLYASIWTVAGLTLSSLLPNKYIALGSPLILGYILEELTYKMPVCFNLYKLSHGYAVFDNSVYWNYIYTIAVFVLVIVVEGCIFSRVVKRRIRNELV